MAYKKKPANTPIHQSLGPIKPDENSLINPELGRFERQVHEILASMESINLMTLGVDDRLKATKTKLELGLKIPLLLQSLDDLRNRAKLRTEDIKGNKNISLLESGEI